MSKFIEKLERLYKGEHQPIGFGIRQSAAPKPKMQIVAIGGGEGADAVVIDSLEAAAGDTPAGCRLTALNKTEMKQLSKSGCDFIIFPAAGTPLSVIETGETGKIIEVEPSINEGLLRSLNELPADAVLVGGEVKKADSPDWQQLMVYKRFSDLLNKPLLVMAPAKLTGTELKALWEAGVCGVIVEAGPDQLKKLRQEIDKLDFPPRRGSGKADAVLPRTGGGAAVPAEDDEDDY
jgi:hypothetical protein